MEVNLTPAFRLSKLSRNSKQLEKFKAEGASANSELEEQMAEVVKRAEESEAKMNESEEKVSKGLCNLP